jgi:hypothetical protein
MQLRFPTARIPALAQQYEARQSARDRRLTAELTGRVFPSYAAKGYLTREEFLTVCAWKTPRSAARCAENDEELIAAVSRLVRTTQVEPLRIQLWTLLTGVQWPTTSVFVHFTFPTQYPILDFRALWSVRATVPPTYTFAFRWQYATFCRELAGAAGVTMRALDQALWVYSKLHQRS